MSKQLGLVWNYLAHYKYLIVIVLGVVVVGFADDNSIMHHVEYQMQISSLRDEIQKNQARYDSDQQLLQQMGTGEGAYAKIAREHYFMKADDEDVFVLSTDLPEVKTENENETTE